MVAELSGRADWYGLPRRELDSHSNAAGKWRACRRLRSIKSLTNVAGSHAARPTLAERLRKPQSLWLSFARCASEYGTTKRTDYRLHGEQMTPIPVYSLLESFKVPGAINCLRAPSANHFQRDRQEGMWPRIRPSYRERERLLFQYPKKQRGRPSVTGEGSVGLLERATCAGGVSGASFACRRRSCRRRRTF